VGGEVEGEEEGKGKERKGKEKKRGLEEWLKSTTLLPECLPSRCKAWSSKPQSHQKANNNSNKELEC
jgi:hypothetical protein